MTKLRLRLEGAWVRWWMPRMVQFGEHLVERLVSALTGLHVVPVALFGCFRDHADMTTSYMVYAGLAGYMPTVGDSEHNALAESVIGLYQAECVRHEGPVRTVDDLELRTLTWVHWFNQTRLHSALGHVPPVEFEEDHNRQINPARNRCRETSPSTEPGAVHSLYSRWSTQAAVG